MVIDNKKSHDNGLPTHQQLLTLLEVTKVIGREKRLDKVLSFLAIQGAEAVGSDRSAIFLIDEKTNEIWSEVALKEPTEIRFPIGEGIAGECIATKKVINIADAYSDHRFNKKIDLKTGFRTKNLLAAPMVSQSGISLGCFQAINKKNGTFNAADESFAQAFSSQAAIAIEVAILHRENKKMIEDLIQESEFQENRRKIDRLASIGELAATILHDFKNPMGAIRGFAEIIMSNHSLSLEKRDRYSQIIISQVDRCVNMVEELLQFARGDKTLEYRRIDIKDLIDEIALLLKVETDRLEITLEISVSYDGTICIDKEKIIRAIFNLTNNALEMLEKGDRLSINVRENTEHLIEIRIRDTGPGIPESIRHNLFDAFITKGKKKGTGLGLYIAKEIIACHEGKLVVEDLPGDEKGSCFVMTLDPSKNTYSLPQAS